MKTHLLLSLASLVLLPTSLLADPPQGGRGRGPGGPGHGKGGGGGPLPAEQREKIHDLFANHKSIQRKVTLTKTGYTSRTTSDDPKVVAKLQEHVAYMEKRLDSGFPVRRWDPAYEEFFQHYDQMETTITKIKTGLEVEVKGKTPEAIKVAQNHAQIVSGFVKKGEEEHHAKHPAVFAKDGKAGGGKGPGGCENCGKDCQCEGGAKGRKKAAAPCPDCEKPEAPSK